MKNLKLLLATTAILSTGLVIETKAASNLTTPEVEISAQATFISSVSAMVNPIQFGTIDVKNGGGTVTISAEDGSVTGTAKILYQNGESSLSRGSVWFEGLNKLFNPIEALSTSTFSLSLTNSTITLYEDESNKVGECGTVSNITQSADGYIPSANSGYIVINLGGTLTIKSGYAPTNQYATCKGSTTVTYVFNPEFSGN